MAESSTLVRRRGFFYDHAVNLSIVGNNRHKRTFRLRPNRTTLKRVQNIF